MAQAMEERQAAGTAIEKRDPGDVATWVETTVARAALPPGLSAGRLAKAVLQTFRKKPDLLDPKKTDQDSLKLAIIDAGMTGLVPDGTHGALVAYKNKQGIGEVQFQPMFQGLVQLVLAVGEVHKVEAHVVYEGDDFDYELGANPRLFHRPSMDPDRGSRNSKPTHVYAKAWLANGQEIFEPMTRAEVYEIRARSKAFQQSSGPWISDEAEMWRKTAMKRLAKYLPKSEQLERAIARDNEVEYAGEAIVEETRPLRGSRTEQVRDRLVSRVPQPPAAAAEAQEVEGEKDGGEASDEDVEDDADSEEAHPVGDPVETPEPAAPVEERQSIETLHRRYMALVGEKRPAWKKDESLRHSFQRAYVGKASTDEFTEKDYEELIKALEGMGPEPKKKAR